MIDIAMEIGILSWEKEMGDLDEVEREFVHVQGSRCRFGKADVGLGQEGKTASSPSPARPTPSLCGELYAGEISRPGIHEYEV